MFRLWPYLALVATCIIYIWTPDHLSILCTLQPNRPKCKSLNSIYIVSTDCIARAVSAIGPGMTLCQITITFQIAYLPHLTRCDPVTPGKFQIKYLTKFQSSPKTCVLPKFSNIISSDDYELKTTHKILCQW